jgi:hypothetical protein
MNNKKLIVRQIIGDAIDGYSRVTVTYDLFIALRGVRPTMPFTAQGDQAGKGIRIFDFDGIKLYSNYDKESRKTLFLMKTEDAQSCLQTIAEQRANEPKLSFNSTMFNRNIVATA